MTERDRILRALVFHTFDARGTEGFLAAVEAVVRFDERWPLIEAELAIERANRLVEEVARKRDTALRVLRESFGVAA